MAVARGEMEETEKTGGSSFSSLSTLSKGAMAGVVGAVVAAGAVAVDLGEKFQESTASMAAAGNIPIKTADEIGQAFLRTGGSTVFSAAQMEQAYGGVAGQLSTLRGFVDNAATATAFMKVSMDLAEESGSSLASSTSDLAKIMQTYGVRVQGAAGVSVDLFNASRLTGQSVDSLTQGMTRLHSQMGAATPAIGDASALLVDLTEHGETGRQAMSALSSMFTGIVTPTKAVTAEQQKLGVTFENSKGQLLPMATIIGELSRVTAGMGAAQAAATLKALGLGGASLKLVSTIQAGLPGFAAAQTAVNNTAAAHQALMDKQATLGRQLGIIKAQFEDVGTSIGLKLIPYVRDALKYFGDIFNYLTGHKTVLEALAIGLGVAAAGFIGLGVAAFIAEASITAGILPAIGLLVAGVVLLATHWSQVWSDIKKWTDDAVAFLRTKFGTLAVLLTGPLAPLILLALHWQQVWTGLQTVTGRVVSGLLTWWRIMGDAFFSLIEGILGSASHLPFVGHYFAAANNAVKQAKSDFDQNVTGWIGDAYRLGAQVGNNLAGGMAASINAAGPGIISSANQMVTHAVAAMRAAAAAHSPSEKTIQLGADLVAGLRIGMTQGSAALGATSTAVVGTAIGSLAAGPAGPAGGSPTLTLEVDGQVLGRVVLTSLLQEQQRRPLGIKAS